MTSRQAESVPQTPPVAGLDQVPIPQGRTSLPPVETWHPPFSGTIDMRIDVDGGWHYMGSPIARRAMVKLFSTILRREPDGSYVLVTPVEMCGITVEDAPFVAVEMMVEDEGRNRMLGFTTNVGDAVIVDEAHPLRFVPQGQDGSVRPYVRVRGGLDALINRATFLELAELGEIAEVDGADWFGVWSSGRFWPMASAAEIEP